MTAKSIPNYRWDPENKRWQYPLTREQYEVILARAPGVRVAPRVEQALEMREAPWREAARVKEQRDVAVTDYKFHTVPFLHQRIAFAFARELPAAALLMEMGTGKTKVALDLIAWRKSRGEVDRVLVVAPNSVLDVWVEEAATHTPQLTAVVLRGDRKKRLALLEGNHDLYVVNYEGVRVLVDALLKRGFGMVVADESSRIKNHSAQQSRCMHRLGNKATYRLALTGTPVTQNPLDIFSQYKFLDPDIFGGSFYRFRSRYAVMGGYGGYEVIEWANMPELHELVYKVAIRYRKQDCLDLPEKLYTTRRVELTKGQAEAYAQMRDEMIALVEGQVVVAPIVLTKLVRLQQITSGFVKTLEGVEVELPGDNPKLKALEEILDEATGKIVVWVHFVHDYHMVMDHAAQAGLNPVGLAGEVPQVDRAPAIAKFQTDDTCRVFVGQVQTAGLGITLHAADTVVYYSNPFSLEWRLQSEDRTHRIGQKRNVTYVDLVATGTIDETVVKILKRKQSLADLVTGDNIGAVMDGGIE